MKTNKWPYISPTELCSIARRVTKTGGPILSLQGITF